MSYVQLSIDVEAYWSEATYYEEVFLPVEVWEEIKESFNFTTYIYELDGKHSETQATIEVDYVSDKYLESHVPQGNDGENLFYHIYEFLDENKYDRSYLYNVQQEVESLKKYETAKIKFKSADKDTLFENLKMYDVEVID
ncbi:hypothetical protein Kirov_107 [Bacillus phage Kirov]|uniref:Uncharacterized protein n=1 Tax=Bacillus phage Kirov TaxID=2783539 RepID=A0A7U3RXP8_9CAUD|nr:hypothetical protein PQE67_gp197 [Bacillus phage Kirov]QOV08306.1 hypothetical protein Kirov_107 [Bacillus phage Kirov]